MAKAEIPPSERPVIACIVAAHATARGVCGPPDRAPDTQRAFGRALRHAALPFPGLSFSLGNVVFSDSMSLQSAIDALTQNGLLAALEDDAGRRGLLAISSGMIDALIEVQTTGRVEEVNLPPRPVTDIDEALSRDFIDLVLSAFSRETDPIEGRDWPVRMRFASRVHDPGQLNLLMQEGPYHLLHAETGFEGTDRQAKISLVLPSDTSLAQPRPGTGSQAGVPDSEWTARMAATLADTLLPLRAVLVRLTQCYGDLERLAVGDLIPFAAQDLNTVTLEDGRGRAVLRGRLGQIGGKRALRLAPDPRAAEAPAPPKEPETGSATPPAAGSADSSSSPMADPPRLQPSASSVTAVP